MIFFLLGFFIVSTLISFKLFRGDIIHPGFIVPAMFTVSCLCTIYNIETWSVNIGSETLFILISGVLCFIITSFLTYFVGIRIASKKNKGSIVDVNYISTDALMPIRVEKVIVIVMIIFQAISSILYLKEVIRIVSLNGGSLVNWTLMMSSYKELTHFDKIDDSISGLVSQLYQLTAIIGKVFAYIVVYNFVTEKKIKNKIYLIPIAVYFISILFSANRLSILRLTLFCVVVYFTLWHKINGWKRSVDFKLIIKTIVIMILVVAIFVALRSVVGRTNYWDPMYYITHYAGGSIQLFDMYIKDPIKTSVWGQQTFYYINQFIGSKFGASDLVYSFAEEFRYSNGANCGNVYTVFRAFYGDFGYFGMLICTAILAVVFSIFYSYIRKRLSRLNEVGIDLQLILFAHISYTYFFMSINYYADYISPNFIKLILFYIVIIYIVQTKLKRGCIVFIRPKMFREHQIGRN